MAEPHFDTAQELIDAFGILANENYEFITPLIDSKVGFSVQRKYSDDLLYIPLKNRLGEDDTAALIHVVYAHPSEEDEFDSHKVPLFIRIATHSKYLANHIDYDFRDENSPTKESVERTKATPTPVGLDFYNDFYYDHHTETFIDSTLDPMDGEQVLDRVFNTHCDTAHEKKGRGIRRNLHIQTLLNDSLAYVVSCLIWILSNLFGRTLDDSQNYFAYLQGYEKKSLKKLSTESLDIFGYKASRSVIILFCFLVVISYAFRYFNEISTPYLDSVFSNNFLALTHSLIILWLLDVVFPLLFFNLINLVIKARSSVAFKKFQL